MKNEKKKEVVIFSDGACRGNPGPGGYGAILKYGEHVKELSDGFRKTTNNRMELMGCIAAMQALKEPCTVSIVSDSKYVVQAIEKGWLMRWKSFGWLSKNKEPIKNRDLWELTLTELHRHDVTCKWIKGHSGHKENERCDRLATSAAKKHPQKTDDGFENPPAIF